MFYFIPGGKKK